MKNMLAAGTRLGPYEISSLLGAGGMGEVYRATDTRLGRAVALKILPSRVSQNLQMRQRFEREARSISSLSHPHICALYDVGRHEDIDFLVMEFIEGETLAARLARGSLPLDQIFRYGMEIADALDTAHRRGVIHRDLKPSNIMLTKSGTKLLDFGLAKLREREPSVASAEWAMATQSRELTTEGTVIGTLQYMSPEQLDGKETDARTDIFSFGTVLYEMATGRKAFSGSTVTSLITAILKSEPEPISGIQPLSPPSLDYVVRICLAKDPDERWQTAHDLGLQLKGIVEGAAPSSAARKIGRTKSRATFSWILIPILSVAVFILALSNYRFLKSIRTIEGEVQKVSILTPDSSRIDSLAVSPDGHYVSFVVSGKEGLWLRALDSVNAVQVPDTKDAHYPFWSPDSRFIGFFAEGKLRKIAIGGGSPTILCDASDPAPGRGGTWNRDGMILFSGGVFGPLFRVAAGGGERTPVTTLDREKGEDAHRWPYFLPDGRHFIYYINGDEHGIYVGSLDSGEKKFLLSEYSRASFVSPGYLIFVHRSDTDPNDNNNGSLMAAKFDSNQLKISGNPFPIVENIEQSTEGGTGGGASFSASNNVLAYVSPEPYGQYRWFDRNGKPLPGPAIPDGFGTPAFSPDEKKLAVGDADNIWILDLTDGTPSRFTFSGGGLPVWSPDGKQIAYVGNDDQGCCGIFRKASNGTGNPELLTHMTGLTFTSDWSQDGRDILFQNRGLETKGDLWVLPLFGDRKPVPFLKTALREGVGSFSPNTKWIAYQSEQSGRFEIYVRGFPSGAGGQWQISTGGGTLPMWRHDGKELFYLAGNNQIMAVSVQTEPTFHAGVPVLLFETHPPSAFGPNNIDPAYRVTRDGQRFLVDTAKEQKSDSAISIILHWQALLKK